MSYNIIITEVAELHVLQACLYYKEQQHGLSERFLLELGDAYNKIAKHPQYYSYIATQNIYRDIKLHRFPHVIIFQIHKNDIIVVDVFNTHRKPII